MTRALPAPQPPIEVVATCTTSDCSEYGVAKGGTFGTVPDEITCGVCGEPCTIDTPADD